MTHTITRWLSGALVALASWLPPAAGVAAPVVPDIGTVEVEMHDSGLPADWFRRGVFIEIYVRAYQDSDGNGIGDLAGLTSRLDYLKDLGVSGIWLMPIFKSEDHDHGYAVANYREIEPDYGTLADFDRLLVEAHKRGIGIIVDYVINHSASAHPMFDDAYDHKNSAYTDWYIFKNDTQPGWTTFAGDPWREAGSRWYYAVFSADLPDFNLRNPAVVDFHLNNLRFWLNRGVDGFRFDATGLLFENSAIAWENQPENHVLMKRIQDLLAGYGKRTMVCEAPGDPAAFAAASSCGSSFAFGIHKHILASIKIGRVMPDLLYSLRTLPVARMGTFLSNHDAFAGARLFKQFDGDERSYRVAAATLLTLPGRPFIYYGEEIGLSHAEPVSNADQALRGPMSWSSEAHAGFSHGPETFRPNVSNWETHNVAAEALNPQSLLGWYTQLIALRKAEPALSLGSFTALSSKDEPVFAFVREHEGSKLLVLLNYAYRDASFVLPRGFKPSQWTPIFPAGARLPLSTKGRPTLKMAPQQVLILKAAG
ncbi:alpha-amylase family glycosyl hydrolase [Piscinibacter sp.]|jgi:alpha-amylase|uniref:alpha-amylase family glycosyl hydrolase n=1 Tax=Piscinibacter sp. TaxID=1903157 RepID=UPI003559EF7A